METRTHNRPFEGSDILGMETTWGICRLTLNRPQARNALSPALVEDLVHAFEDLRHSEDVRVIELTGSGESVFCAGGDLSGSGLSGDHGFLEAHQGRARFAALLKAIRHVGKPVVATVQGHALGGGFGLAMACDLIVAAEEATFGTPEIKVGLFPMIILPVLMRNIPQKKLMELILLGEKLSAQEALTHGLVNRVVPRASLRESADGLLQSLVQKSPAVLRLGRDAFYHAQDLTLDHALDHMVSQLTLNLQLEDALEGLSAFMQKRPPEWKGR